MVHVLLPFKADCSIWIVFQTNSVSIALCCMNKCFLFKTFLFVQDASLLFNKMLEEIMKVSMLSTNMHTHTRVRTLRYTHTHTHHVWCGWGCWKKALFQNFQKTNKLEIKEKTKLLNDKFMELAIKNENVMGYFLDSQNEYKKRLKDILYVQS